MSSTIPVQHVFNPETIPAFAKIQHPRPIGPRNDLLAKVRGFIERYVAFENPFHSLILSLWVVHTHAFDAAYTTPYLYITSAEKQSGKTRTIEACEVLSRNPVMASNISAASIFRLIEAARPTLFVDEADTIFTGAKNEDLRSILNSGYKHNGTTMRFVGGKADDESGGARTFSTFAPKLLAGIDNGELPDTIADRCIKIVLKRKKGDVNVARFVRRRVETEAEALKVEIHNWAMDNLNALMDLEVQPIDELSDRAWDISEPLVQVAHLLGYEDETREGLRNLLTKGEAKLSPGAQVLKTARDLFDSTGGDRIMSSTLAEATGYTATKVGKLLAPYGVSPTTVRFHGGIVAKGYHRADFADAWERYL